MRPSYLDMPRENPVSEQPGVPVGEAPSLQGYLEERNAAVTARVAAEAEAAAARHAASEAEIRMQDLSASLAESRRQFSELESTVAGKDAEILTKSTELSAKIAECQEKDDQIKRLTADLEEATKPVSEPAATNAVEEKADAKPDAEDDQSGA
jgi:chromosome segregation ATPase